MKRLSCFVASLATLTVLCNSCGHGQKVDQAKADAEKAADAEQIAAIAKQSGAVVGWQKKLQRRGAASVPFTYDLMRVLMPSNGAPILLVMALEDVSEHGGGFQARFSHFYTKEGLFELSLELSCTPEQATELLADNRNSWERSYAIVARFTQIVRPPVVISNRGSEYHPEVGARIEDGVIQGKADCVQLVRLKALPAETD